MQIIRLLPLVFLAIVANAGTIFIINYSSGLPGDDVPFWDTLLNVEWVACMVVALVICIVSRRVLFSKKNYILEHTAAHLLHAGTVDTQVQIAGKF